MAKLGKQPSKKEIRDAIKAMCVQCMGGEESPGFRREIANCSAKICPLRPYRPYKSPVNELETILENYDE